MSEQLALFKAALEYMDKSNALTEIEKTANIYDNIQDKAFHFSVSVDPIELIESSVSLGNLVLDHPNGAAKIFQEVVYETLKCKESLPQCTSQSQVVVTFELQSLPALPGYQLSSSSDLLKYADKKRFLQYQGIVIGRSTLHKYTKSARFVCPESECFGSEGNQFIRLHIPGARETQTIRGDFTCTYCGSQLQEDISCRLLADRLIVEVVDSLALACGQLGQNRFQAMTLYIRDEHVNSIEIGQQIDVIGIPVFDLYQNTLALEVNNILQLNCDTSNDFVIPSSILKLYQDRKKSPWSFTVSLAYAFASEVAAAGTFIHLKLGLLLSLVGDNTKESGGLDLLAVGTDTLLLDRLLSFAAEIADRSVVHSINHHLTSAVNKDRHGSGAPFIEGGSILLAGNGVCVLKNLSNIKKKTKYELLQVLESNSVFVDVSGKASKPKTQLFLPRRCCIWGSSEPDHSKKSVSFGADQLIGTVDQEHVTQDLANAFGQVYFCEVKSDTYADCLLLNQGLMAAMSCAGEPLIPKQDLKVFIRYARSKKVTFTEEAEQFIRGYYAASRRVRNSSVHGASLPMTAIKAITSLAGAHAKLSLRDLVDEFDATIAVLLYEEHITVRSGYSILNVQPLVHLPDNNILQHLGPQLDKDMLQFHQMLKHFIATHASEIDRFTEE